ncbi:MAG: Gfo/Idh/MocA family oxidoreductase [Kiritimatiellae bacterium]|nr:Gfo/Idh/MocA family oxidoreductase [Kiritimatiellia bacterium]
MSVKVAFIGVGGIAGQHLSSLRTIGGTEIVGLCGVDKKRLAKRQAEFGGETFTDPAAMLKATRPDTAFICLPPFAHGAAELACLRYRVPFMVEKPVAIDMKTAKKILSGVKRTGVMAAAGYMSRYRAGIQRARELLSRDPAGLICGGWVGGFPGKHPWLFQKEKSGGQLLEQTTHIVDLLRYLCGEAESVSCYAADRSFVRGARGFTADCASAAAIKMKSGAVANITSAWLSKAGGTGVYLTLFSRDHMIEFSGWNNDVRITHAGGQHVEQIKGETNIFEIEDAAWIKAVKNGKPTGVLSDYADAVKSLAISLAANESMATGKPVKVR